MEHESALSDALLRQLMAVGQVDVLVGLPTLNNAATVPDVIRAVNVCFNRDFPRLRTVMINSDGGSTDGTPDLIRLLATTDADTVLTSHSLRTLHRVVAPYHGLPGKHSALRTVFTAAELTQARVLVVIDPAGPATGPERITELVSPIARADVEFLAPRFRRHPRDGLLVTQLARPFVQAVYGVALDEPLASEFSCAGRFVSHCVDREIWRHESARFAIDLLLRTEAIARGFRMGQIWRPPTSAPGPRASLREAVQQVVGALVGSLVEHESHWLTRDAVVALPSWGDDSAPMPDAAAWDHELLADQARRDIRNLEPLLQTVLDETTMAALREDLAAPLVRLDIERWVEIVYAFAAASRRSQPGADQLAGMFVPLYLWRAAAFMTETALEDAATVQQRLDSLCTAFHRLKPVLVSRWKAGM